MTKLNIEAKKVLKAKILKFKEGQNFSIAFLGDSHIGQKNCTNEWYIELLKQIKYKNVYAAIHGGDASDYGGDQLRKYVDITEKILGYNEAINVESTIPLFTNIGNNDYKIGKSSSKGMGIKDYNNFIGNDNTIIKLYKGRNGPRIAIVLLNTGYNVYGELSDGKDYKTEFDKLEKNMNDIIKLHHSVRFIIDMHIPPRIPDESKFIINHSMDNKFNDAFQEFLKKNPSKIMAIVTHHIHGCIQTAAYHYTFNATVKTKEGNTTTKRYSIPVYLTAQGGHCNFNKKYLANGQHSFYIMNFTKTGKHYSISTVYRFSILKSSDGNYVLSTPILIDK